MENEVNVIKMGTLDKVLTECKLWGCGFNYNELTDNYVLCDKRPNRFKPYLAVCKTNRKEDRRYLPFGGRVTYGEFDVKNVKYGDVLFGGFFDKQKCQFVRERYYVVLSNNKKDGLTVADGSWTTYNKAYNYKRKKRTKTVTVSPMKDVLSTIELKRLECLREIAKARNIPYYRTAYWTADVMKNVEYREGYGENGSAICYHKPSGRYFDTECDKQYEFKLFC